MSVINVIIILFSRFVWGFVRCFVVRFVCPVVSLLSGRYLRFFFKAVLPTAARYVRTSSQ